MPPLGKQRCDWANIQASLRAEERALDGHRRRVQATGKHYDELARYASSLPHREYTDMVGWANHSSVGDIKQEKNYQGWSRPSLVSG